MGDASNTLRILVATDCHLGYMEKDEIRRHDSFQAFEEVCSIAEQKEVIPTIYQIIFLSTSNLGSVLNYLPMLF